MVNRDIIPPETQEYICEKIASGVPLREICREKGMPSYRTVYRLRLEDDAFEARFARARDIGYDVIAEEALSIADTPIIGQVEKDSAKDGITVTRADMTDHRRLQVDTRLKLLAKWSQRYSDKIAQQQLDRNGNPTDPLPAVINLTIEEKK